jgi:hypothetical protein
MYLDAAVTELWAPVSDVYQPSLLSWLPCWPSWYDINESRNSHQLAPHYNYNTSGCSCVVFKDGGLSEFSGNCRLVALKKGMLDQFIECFWNSIGHLLYQVTSVSRMALVSIKHEYCEHMWHSATEFNDTSRGASLWLCTRWTANIPALMNSEFRESHSIGQSEIYQPNYTCTKRSNIQVVRLLVYDSFLVIIIIP